MKALPHTLPWDHSDYAETLAKQKAVGLIDLHIDPVIQQRLFGYDLKKAHSSGIWGQPFIWHSDIPRMLQAGYGASCLGIHYWRKEDPGGLIEAQKQIDYIDKLCAEDPRTLRIRGPADFDRAVAEGKVGLVPGVEGCHILNGNIESLYALAKRNFAYLTLAHFSKNAAATPSMGKGANENDKLTEFGQTVVRELNRLKVAVDVAHLNMPCALHACELTEFPLFCTHTGVKAVSNKPRNISDDLIRAIAARDGVIGIMVGSHFLRGDAHATTIDLCNHIDHITSLVGPRHIAWGSDYDGWLPKIVNDHKDCRDAVKVSYELKKRGYSDEHLRMFQRENSMRVYRAVAGDGQFGAG